MFKKIHKTRRFKIKCNVSILKCWCFRLISMVFVDKILSRVFRSKKGNETG